MRELKFRIWDKLNNRMMCHNDLNTLLKELNKLDFGTEILIPQNNNYKILQYTGLKDRNGVEIYEGDIVWILNNSPQMIELDRGVVEMINGCWEVEGYSLYSQYKTLIVGNIYENPELLKRDL